MFLTDNSTLRASTIAAIYKDCWQVELFIKVVKQNLEIKAFIKRKTLAQILKPKIHQHKIRASNEALNMIFNCGAAMGI